MYLTPLFHGWRNFAVLHLYISCLLFPSGAIVPIVPLYQWYRCYCLLCGITLRILHIQVIDIRRVFYEAKQAHEQALAQAQSQEEGMVLLDSEGGRDSSVVLGKRYSWYRSRVTYTRSAFDYTASTFTAACVYLVCDQLCSWSCTICLKRINHVMCMLAPQL